MSSASRRYWGSVKALKPYLKMVQWGARNEHMGLVVCGLWCLLMALHAELRPAPAPVIMNMLLPQLFHTYIPNEVYV